MGNLQEIFPEQPEASEPRKRDGKLIAVVASLILVVLLIAGLTLMMATNLAGTAVTKLGSGPAPTDAVQQTTVTSSGGPFCPLPKQFRKLEASHRRYTLVFQPGHTFVDGMAANKWKGSDWLRSPYPERRTRGSGIYRWILSPYMAIKPNREHPAHGGLTRYAFAFRGTCHYGALTTAPSGIPFGNRPAIQAWVAVAEPGGILRWVVIEAHPIR